MEPNAHLAGANKLHDGGFVSILNFRDVGATINARLGKPLLRERVLYRSARPDEATVADRDRLRTHYGIQTVMDLRSKSEHHSAAEKRAADAKAGTAANPALAEPVHIPGITYREVRVTGAGFEKLLLSRLGWGSFFKLISLYTIGQRNPAISILGREVMSPRGLLGLAADTLDASGTDISEGLSTLLTPPGPPMLVHCTQGKDRTGLMIALLLLICGVDLDAIEYDYELSDEKLAEERGERLQEIRAMGLSEEFGRTVKGYVQGIMAHLEERYGGLEAYLDGIGFGAGERVRVREALLL